MSANQIPYFGPKHDDDWTGKPRPHSCVRCIFNGGEGHTLRELQKLRRNELDYVEETRIVAVSRPCNYWSARAQKRCGSTHRVKVFGIIGPRCEAHDHDVMTARYKALTEPVALAV